MQKEYYSAVSHNSEMSSIIIPSALISAVRYFVIDKRKPMQNVSRAFLEY